MVVAMNQEIIGLRDLKAWREDVKLANGIDVICVELSKKGLHSLAGRMKRAAVSVSSNITKGFFEEHAPEHHQFVYLAVSSLRELETQVHAADQRGFLREPSKSSILSRIARLRAMLILLEKERS